MSLLNSKRKELGLSKLDLIRLIRPLQKRLFRVINKRDETLMVSSALRAVGELVEKVGDRADKEWRTAIHQQAYALIYLGNALDKGGVKMAKIELGITPKELLSAVPALAAAAWAHYQDDQKITADEGLLIAALVLEQLGSATDDSYLKNFFNSQAQALRGLAPLFEPEEVVVEEVVVVDIEAPA